MTTATASSEILRPPLVEGGKTYGQITDDICAPMEKRPPLGWFAAFTVAGLALLWGVIMVTDLIWTGVGTWGLNKTVSWGFAITNFVFWVGIGHAGTLISAILLLFRQKWRTAINRSAEAMTIFAVMCAGLNPLLHMGRIWRGLYWLFPYYPNTMGPLFVNFRSPLLWDVFAVSTYLTISLLFWYMGLLPDLATAAAHAKGAIRRFIFRVLSLGWSGSARTWLNHEKASLLLAGLATPLVLSVHTVVSMDFACAMVPGWHSTIFPPFFVAGAIFSGFAMVLTLLTLSREFLGFKDYITLKHIDAMAKVTLLTSMIVSMAYLTETLIGWYSANTFERFYFINAATGPYRYCYWTQMLCNVVAPQFFWFKKFRRSPVVAFIISIFINIGMWLERFNIIVIGLHRDFLTSSWTMYRPTYVDWGLLIGLFGLFFTCFLLFSRSLPMIAMSEIKHVLSSEKHGEKQHA